MSPFTGRWRFRGNSVKRDWNAYDAPADLAEKCARLGLIRPFGEYFFHTTRRWRFDLAWPAARIAIEIQGGFACLGAHARIAGAIRDMEKHNAAVLCGWRLLYFTPQQVASDEAVFFLLQNFPELNGEC